MKAFAWNVDGGWEWGKHWETSSGNGISAEVYLDCSSLAFDSVLGSRKAAQLCPQRVRVEDYLMKMWEASTLQI